MYNNQHIRRTWFYVFNIFSIICNIIMLAALMYASYSADELFGVNNRYASYLSIGAAACGGMVIMNILLFRFFRLSDEDLIKNKYFIGVVGLFSGQVIIPFLILCSIPNTNSINTISPKIIVSKSYGTTFLWTGIAGMLSMLLITKFNKPVLNDWSLENIFCVIYLAIALYGVINILMFIRRSFCELLDNGKKLNIFQLILGVINCIIATIGLILLMIFSVISFIEAIGRLINGKRHAGALGFLTLIGDIFNVAYTFAKMMMIIKYATQTMKVIWSKEPVEMHAYEKMNEYNNRQNRNVA